MDQRYSELKTLRSGAEQSLRDIQKYVRPNGGSFDNLAKSMGSVQEDGSKNICDPTAVWACQMFANGLSSYLVPRSDRWAYFKPVGIPSAELTDEQLVYLEKVSDMMFHVLALPDSRFYQASHECFYDQGSYGTSVVYVKPTKTGTNFRSCPLGDCYFDVDDEDQVDTMYYRRFMRTSAFVKMFPQVMKFEDFDPKNMNRVFEVVYAVEPNRAPLAKKGGRLGSTRPYTAKYFCPDFKQILSEGHLSYFPFLVPRWTVISGEVWGRGPAHTCLASIEMINRMESVVIRAGEMAIEPPLTAEVDSILLPMKYGKRQILWREPGMAAPEPVLSGTDPGITMDRIQRHSDHINRAFFVDQILREQKKERQSVLEIQDERGQMLQQLGPALARQETEFLDPAIDLTFNMLQDKGWIEAPPASLFDAKLELVYTSPAAHAQYASRIADIHGFMGDITPLVQADPTVMDEVNKNELLDHYARYRNLPRAIINTKKQADEIRAARAEAEQQQQAMAAVPEMAGAMKDVASAKATDPEGIGQMLGGMM